MERTAQFARTSCFVASGAAALKQLPLRCGSVVQGWRAQPKRSIWRQRSCVRAKVEAEEGKIAGAAHPADEDSKGSLLGATLLVSGCAIGAGMLILPARTATAGLFPAEAIMLAACVFNAVSSLLFLEGTDKVSKHLQREREAKQLLVESPEAPPLSLSSVANQALKNPLPASCALSAMQFALLAVYTAEASHLVARLFDTSNVWASGVAFAAAISGLLCFGSPLAIDMTNRVVFGGLGASFIGLVTLLSATTAFVAGSPQGLTSAVAYSNWAALWPAGASVSLIAFQSQCITPAVYQYLGGDMRRARKAIVLGHVIPFALYSAWESVVLHSTSASVAANFAVQVPTTVDAVFAMLQASGASTDVCTALLMFAIFAASSSFIGLGISLRDTITSLIQHGSLGVEVDHETQLKVRPYARYFAFVLLMAPALLASAENSSLWRLVLDKFGVLGALAINGLLPAAIIASVSKGFFAKRANSSALPAVSASETAIARQKAQLALPTSTLATGMVIASFGLLVPESVRVIVDLFTHSAP
uniref:Amino acid transporter transmembrane domain-containing protein n=1 Tax=Erythrolobus australicus TaxID=1077150 RepID=A0A7S1XJP3_9RHOD